MIKSSWKFPLMLAIFSGVFWIYVLLKDTPADEQTFVVGIETNTAVSAMDLNRTKNNRFSTGTDADELKVSDTVVLEVIETITPNFGSTKTYNVYYADAYDMKDIADGIHLKTNQLNHLEKAVVMTLRQANAVLKKEAK